jgi:hypothetical protein
LGSKGCESVRRLKVNVMTVDLGDFQAIIDIEQVIGVKRLSAAQQFALGAQLHLLLGFGDDKRVGMKLSELPGQVSAQVDEE